MEGSHLHHVPGGELAPCREGLVSAAQAWGSEAEGVTALCLLFTMGQTECIAGVGSNIQVLAGSGRVGGLARTSSRQEGDQGQVVPQDGHVEGRHLAEPSPVHLPRVQAL